MQKTAAQQAAWKILEHLVLVILFYKVNVKLFFETYTLSVEALYALL